MSKKKENELRKAALEGDIPALTALIASGTNLEGGSPKDGQTALMMASANGYVDVVEILIKAGAKLETRDKFGYTAMHVAATQGEVEVLKFLLANGAELEAKDKFGNKPILKAQQQKHPEAVKALEEAMRAAAAPPPAAPPPAPKRAVPDDGIEVKVAKHVYDRLD